MRPFLIVLTILMLLTIGAGAQAPAPDAPRSPIIGPTSWLDPLDDTMGLSWLDGTRQVNGAVSLSQLEPLGVDVGGIWAVAEGPNGIFYLGVDDAYLWSYDSATGAMANLGAPVPDECYT